MMSAAEIVGEELRGVVMVDKIDEIVFFGGPLCRHTQEGGVDFWSVADREGGGKKTHLEDHTYVEPGEENGNPEHVGCPGKAGKERVVGGTYLIVGANITRETLEEAKQEVIKVVVTAEANMEEVWRIIRQCLGF